MSVYKPNLVVTTGLNAIIGYHSAVIANQEGRYSKASARFELRNQRQHSNLPGCCPPLYHLRYRSFQALDPWRRPGLFVLVLSIIVKFWRNFIFCQNFSFKHIIIKNLLFLILKLSLRGKVFITKTSLVKFFGWTLKKRYALN